MSQFTEAYKERLQTVFERYCDPDRWKNPFMCVVEDEEERGLLIEAINFYMADTPEEDGRGIVICHGYQAD